MPISRYLIGLLTISIVVSGCDEPVTPLPGAGPPVFASVSAGSSHTCSLTVEGFAYCWGSNSSGELGTGDTIPQTGPVRVATDVKFSSISAGDGATCGITDGNVALCWGNVGPEITPVGGSQHFSSIGVGNYFPMLCATTIEGSVKCGSGSTPFTFDSPVPQADLVTVSAGGYFGVIEYGESGNGPGPNGFWCGLTSDGQAYCGFDDQYGQRGDGPGNAETSASAVAGGLLFTEISADGLAGRHVCGIAVDGITYCWGGNENGELGTSTTELCQPLGISGDNAGVPCSSTPIEVQLSVDFVSVNVGGGFTCGITAPEQSLALCWGANGSGQLGNGTTQPTNLPDLVSGGHHFTDISAGEGHACGVTSNGEVFCWGENSSGQVGDGTETDQLAPVAIIPAEEA